MIETREIEYFPNEQISIDIPVENYPDGFPVLNINHKSIAQKYNYHTSKLLVRPKSFNAFMQAMLFVDAMDYRGMPIKTLVLPYLPGARQDRLNSAGDLLFSAKSIANEINNRNFESVICFDPHSDVMPALIDHCTVVHVDEIEGLIDNKCYDGIIAPDAGAAKRAETIAKTLGLPVFNAWKVRDTASKSSKIVSFGIEDVRGTQRLLIVDDICDGGGTFIGLASHICDTVPSPPEISLYTSHGLYTKGLEKLDQFFAEIITTNSTTYCFDYKINTKLKVKDIITHLINKG